MSFLTEQEFFWAGEFGNHYIERNKSSKLVSANIRLFAKIFENLTTPPDSILELWGEYRFKFDSN